MLLELEVLLLVLTGFYLFVEASTGYVHGLSNNQYFALYDFYNATNGEWWDWGPSRTGKIWKFNQTANPCSSGWQGLTCQCSKSKGKTNYNNCTLSQISLSSYNLTGTIPFSFGNLSSLTFISLSSNQISGPLPESFGNLQKLSNFYISYNKLTSLPNSLYKCSSLVNLYLAYNSINGTISPMISNLQQLSGLYLYNNFFYGSLPASFYNLTSMASLEIQYNFFTGTISDQIVKWSKLVTLYLNDNLFFGTISAHFPGTPIKLGYFNVGNNLFSGPIPSNLKSAKYLDILGIESNSFAGVWNLGNDFTYLTYLSVSDNFLHGNITDAASFINYGYITNFDISLNTFTGEIPPVEQPSGFKQSRCSLTLTSLVYSNNYLSGSLPHIICTASNMNITSFGNNQLSGIIPTNYSVFKNSDEFYLNNNYFTGLLPDVLAVFTPSDIQSLDLSTNSFTGSITSTFLNGTVGNLQVLDLGNNCLSGSLPQEICALERLTTLILDGASSSSNCQTYIFPDNVIFNGFISAHTLDGTIPSCLFGIRTLQTLHLAGNGFTGDLPASLNVSDALTDLSLSHNYLTGSIPRGIQLKTNWLKLDLSYNKLTGTLESSFSAFDEATSSSSSSNNENNELLFSLQLNRISGNVPSSLLSISSSISSLSILQGNIFNCFSSQRSSSLPTSDENYNNYDCSSDTSLLIIIVVVVHAGIALLLALLYFNSTIRTTFIQFYNNTKLWQSAFSTSCEGSDSTTDSNSPLVPLKEYFDSVQKFILVIIGFGLIIILPVWIGLSSRFYSYDYESVWAVAAIFLRGQDPALALFFMFSLSILVFFYFAEVMLTNKKKGWQSVIMKSSDSPSQANTQNHWIDRVFIFLVCFSVFIVNSSIMLGIDVAFVLAVLNVSSKVLMIVDIIVAIARITMNNVVLWMMLPFFVKCFEPVYQKITSSESEKPRELLSLIPQKAFLGKLLILNTILYPALSILVVLPNCFYYIFTQAPTVHSSYSSSYCTLLLGCESESIFSAGYVTITGSTDFVPPFSYSYLCSANIITYYTSVFIWSFLLSGIGIPLFKLTTKVIYDWLEVKEDAKSHEKGLEMNEDLNAPDKAKQPIPRRKTMRYLLEPMLIKRFRRYSAEYSEQSLPIFNCDKFTCQVNSHLASMFIYGIIFPPLLIIGGLCTLVSIQFEFLTLGKLLHETNQLGYHWYAKVVEEETKRIVQTFQSDIGWIVFISCLFFGFIIFDTWGDTDGFDAGIIGFIIMMVIPVGAMRIYFWFKVSLMREEPKSDEKEGNLDGKSGEQSVGIELNEVSKSVEAITTSNPLLAPQFKDA